MSHSRTQSSFRFRPRVDGLEVRAVPAAIPLSAAAIAPGKNSDPKVVVIDPATGNPVFTCQPFEPSFRGGANVALGDVTGDGTPDLVIGTGTGGGPRVVVVDGQTGQTVKDFFVYEPSFRGGVSVAVGDVNGDGRQDIITGTGTGGGPRVVVIDYQTGQTIRDFMAFEGTFRGGVTVASADVNNDGFDDIAVGTGVGGAPRVTVFSGKDGSVLQNFFAYNQDFRNGVNVGTADVDGDGRPDIVTGAGTGGAPLVRVFQGLTGNDLGSFFAFDQGGRGGVRVALVDTDGDGKAEIVAGVPGQIRKFLRQQGTFTPTDMSTLGVRGDDGVTVAGTGDGHQGRGHKGGNKGGDNNQNDDGTADQGRGERGGNDDNGGNNSNGHGHDG